MLEEKWICNILLTMLHVLDENFSKEKKYAIQISLVNTLSDISRKTKFCKPPWPNYIYIFLNLIIKGIFSL